MKKTLILVHGRSWKPRLKDLKKLWIDAIKSGLNRDEATLLSTFQGVRIEFVYYGDISNDFLRTTWGKPVPKDTADRRRTLEALKAWKATQFTKSKYNRLPGKESLKEGVSDTLGPLLRFFRLSDNLIQVVAPDVGEYWKGEDSYFGSAVREVLAPPLRKAMDRRDSVFLVGHSLGSMIAYDTLWKFSYRGEYRPSYSDKKVDYFVTLGSPLGDATVQAGLFGANASGERRYPANIRRWINIAAEDDFICHDGKLANDYRNMKRLGMLNELKDYHIYNLSVRDEKSNPHHSGGYLIHPRFIETLAQWLKA